MTATASGHVLLSSGSNARGQLANGTIEDAHQFQPCSFHDQPPGSIPNHITCIIDVASGANHTILLVEVTRNNADATQRELWGCGDGSSGQLGLKYQNEVKQRPEEDPWSMVFQPLDLDLGTEGLQGYQPKIVAASWETTYVVLASENMGGDLIISMGSDVFGDLGVGGLEKAKERESKPFHIVNFDHLFVKGKNIAREYTRVKSLNAGQHHLVAELEVEGSDEGACLVGWGASRHGQLGRLVDKVGKPWPLAPKPVLVPHDRFKGPISSVSLGMQHTVLLHTSGKVTGIGSNRKGQLEGLDQITNAKRMGCTWNGTYVCAENEDQSLQILSTGSHMHGQLGRKAESLANTSPSLAPVDWAPPSSMDIACGTEHVLVRLNDTEKEVWGWGWNEHGNMGTGTTEDVCLPQKIWPSAKFKGYVQSIHGIWGGCGTGWIYAKIQ